MIPDWAKVDNSDSVSSVNGQQGAVVLNPDNLDDTGTSHKFVSQGEKDDFHGHANKSELDLWVSGDRTDLMAHKDGNGSDHADVASNNTHRLSDGSDHSDVVANTAHKDGDGSDHADVASNTAHRNQTSGNPHDLAPVDIGASAIGHTHQESEIVDLDHDAAKIKGIPVDTPVAGDDTKIPEFDYDDQKIKWVDKPETSAPVHGTKFQEESDLGLSSTTSGSWQQKLRLTTDVLPQGKYRIGWSYEWRYSRTSSDFEARVQVNDTDTLMEQTQEPKDSQSDQSTPSSGFAYFEGNGVLNIDLDYRRSASGASGYTYMSSNSVQLTPVISPSLAPMLAGEQPLQSNLTMGGESEESDTHVYYASAGTAYIRRARLEIWRVS